MRIVLLGAPGAGKGAQAALLSKKLDVPQISTGDIFRHNLKNETPLGVLAKGYMDKGLLVPDEITISIVQDRITKNDCKFGFILDGFPRTIPQSKGLDKVLNKIGIKLDCAINFDIADEVIVKRLAGRRVCPICGKTFHIENDPPKEQGMCDVCHVTLIQRADDKEETVFNRLLSYHEQAESLIDYYRRKNILMTINAEKLIDEISSEVIAYIEKISFSNKERIAN